MLVEKLSGVDVELQKWFDEQYDEIICNTKKQKNDIELSKIWAGALSELDRLYNYGMIIHQIEEPFQTLSEMVNTESYCGWVGDKLVNDLFINDPDRARRIYDCAESGCDGSTHAEVIDDEQKYLDDMIETYDLDDGSPDDLWNAGNGSVIFKTTYDRISKDIEDVRVWHDKAGTLYNQIG